MKKVYLVYYGFNDGIEIAVKVFFNQENAENYVAKGNKSLLGERDFYWWIDLEVADYSETIQNDEKF